MTNNIYNKIPNPLRGWILKRQIKSTTKSFWKDVDRVNTDSVLAKHSPLSVHNQSRKAWKANCRRILKNRLSKYDGRRY